jgi:hypothetical protein
MTICIASLPSLPVDQKPNAHYVLPIFALLGALLNFVHSYFMDINFFLLKLALPEYFSMLKGFFNSNNLY